jgi:hypothetical protein
MKIKYKHKVQRNNQISSSKAYKMHKKMHTKDYKHSFLSKVLLYNLPQKLLLETTSKQHLARTQNQASPNNNTVHTNGNTHLDTLTEPVPKVSMLASRSGLLSSKKRETRSNIFSPRQRPT